MAREDIIAQIAKIKIERNTGNGGFCAFFDLAGQQYWADLTNIEYVGTECMIFPSKDGEVTSWSYEYCNRGIPLTEQALRDCILEFVEERLNSKIL